jgi:hypothetical protein
VTTVLSKGSNILQLKISLVKQEMREVENNSAPKSHTEAAKRYRNQAHFATGHSLARPAGCSTTKQASVSFLNSSTHGNLVSMNADQNQRGYCHSQTR